MKDRPLPIPIVNWDIGDKFNTAAYGPVTITDIFINPVTHERVYRVDALWLNDKAGSCKPAKVLLR